MLFQSNVPKNTNKKILKYFQMILNGKKSLNITIKNPNKKKLISNKIPNSVMV